jgi:acyl-coenzyme A thioesterase PaaI-like protein
MKLEDNGYCFVCGERNRHGFNLKFTIDEDNVMWTKFTPARYHQGFKDMVHGGIIGLILDEVMVNLAWRLKRHVISAELNIKLRKPVRPGEKLLFRGWIDKEARKIIYTKAEAKNEYGAVVATATAKCIRVDN